MLKPERIWAVGDKTFPTYEEARTYIASRRGELQREALIDVVHNTLLGLNIPGETETVASVLANVLLAKFKITPRKP